MGGFGRETLPYGVSSEGHVVVAYRDEIVDLARLARLGDASSFARLGDAGAGFGADIFASGSLNALMALGAESWAGVRRWVTSHLGHLPSEARLPLESVDLVLPFEVADYVDFYSCEAHVLAMGRLLRPGEDPLPPAWKYVPMGYHGRAATVVVSGEPVPRPSGVVSSDAGPQCRPCARLDVEMELGFVVGVGNGRGQPVPASRAEEHIFGVVLVNDWSARDLQAFEHRPLGPFLGKSFATSVSPWVVPLEALQPWRVAGPLQDPPPAPYLHVGEPRGFDITLELSLNGTALSRASTAGLYWSMAQQYAHLTVNGARTRTGELFATGTVSGNGPGAGGSLMELTSAGREPVRLAGGSTRAWLEDGDEIVIRGWCGTPGEPGWISLGEVRGRVVPATPSTVTAERKEVVLS
jgi:fumarylacetoacetase